MRETRGRLEATLPDLGNSDNESFFFFGKWLAYLHGTVNNHVRHRRRFFVLNHELQITDTNRAYRGRS